MLWRALGNKKKKKKALGLGLALSPDSAMELDDKHSPNSPDSLSCRWSQDLSSSQLNTSAAVREFCT